MNEQGSINQTSSSNEQELINRSGLINNADSVNESDSINNRGAILLSHCGTRKVSREELKLIPVPNATRTHQPLSHYEITEVLREALSFRYLRVVRDEYAVSSDGMKMFGVMDLSTEFGGCRFSIGLRNSNDKSMRLALTAGLRVAVCDNMMFSGDFSPLLHKHTRKLELLDAVSIAVDRIQRGFAHLKRQITDWQEAALSDNQVKLIIYEAFLDKRLKVPKHLMTLVHQNYFHPQEEAFQERTFWSLSNAFTSAFKKLLPIQHFSATAKLGTFLSEVYDRLPDEVLERLYGQTRFRESEFGAESEIEADLEAENGQAELIPFRPYLVGPSNQTTDEITAVAEFDKGNPTEEELAEDDKIWDLFGDDKEDNSFDSEQIESVVSEQSEAESESEQPLKSPPNRETKDKVHKVHPKSESQAKPKAKSKAKPKTKASNKRLKVAA